MADVTAVPNAIAFRVDDATLASIKVFQESEKRRYIGEMVRVLVEEAIAARKVAKRKK